MSYKMKLYEFDAAVEGNAVSIPAYTALIDYIFEQFEKQGIRVVEVDVNGAFAEYFKETYNAKFEQEYYDEFDMMLDVVIFEHGADAMAFKLAWA